MWVAHQIQNTRLSGSRRGRRARARTHTNTERERDRERERKEICIKMGYGSLCFCHKTLLGVTWSASGSLWHAAQTTQREACGRIRMPIVLQNGDATATFSESFSRRASMLVFNCAHSSCSVQNPDELERWNNRLKQHRRSQNQKLEHVPGCQLVTVQDEQNFSKAEHKRK